MRLATSQSVHVLATQNEGWVPPIPAATATLSKLSESDIVTTAQLSEGVAHEEARGERCENACASDLDSPGSLHRTTRLRSSPTAACSPDVAQGEQGEGEARRTARQHRGWRKLSQWGSPGHAVTQCGLWPTIRIPTTTTTLQALLACPHTSLEHASLYIPRGPSMMPGGTNVPAPAPLRHNSPSCWAPQVYTSPDWVMTME